LLAARWLLGLALLWHLQRNSTPVPRCVTGLFYEVAGLFGRGVQLLMSERISVPLVFGWRRPVILVPASLCRLGDEEELRFGLAHEWSHVERGDLYRWHLATLASVLFWWQPLAWRLRRLLRLDQDFLADALAAEQAREPEDYATYLVTLARRSLPGPVPAALGVADRRSNLSRRVLMLIHSSAPLRRRCPRRWNLVLAVATLALVGLVSAVRLDAGDAPKKAPEETPKEAPKAAEPAMGEKLDYSGTVTDKDTGKPIAGATVTVRRSVYGDPEVKASDLVLEESKHKTDSNGKYQFTIPPEQTAKRYLYIELDVEAPGYAPRKGFGYALSMIRKNETIGGRPFFESVSLRPGKEISGVIETPDGKPAVGVKVLSYSVTSNRSRERFEYGSFADTKTDAKGRFSLTIVTPGDGAFWILPKQHAPALHVLKDNQRGDVGKFVLQEGIVLRGKVVDAKGKPLAGIYVHADRDGRAEALAQLAVADSISRTSRTDDKGEFTFRPLPPGAYRVQPRKYGTDPSDDRLGRKEQELPAVFLPQKVVLKEGEKPEALEVRAVPHVLVEVQHVNSKGDKTRGHGPMLFGQIDGQFWHTDTKTGPDGKVSAMAPHGLTQTRLQLMTNEHGSLRHRVSNTNPFRRGREIELGTLDRDVKGIEVVVYKAPILLVKVSEKGGGKPKDAVVTVQYPPQKGLREGRFIAKGGRQTDVTFEEQKDGRFRSSQFLPDEDATVTAHAEGYADKSVKVKIDEGTTKEIEIELEKK
jgi:protocatechuate 3,4-dioxygenase beta subunit